MLYKKTNSVLLSIRCALLLLPTFAMLVSCRSPSAKTSAALDLPHGVHLPTAEALLSVGTNYRARLSPDGLKVIFISRDRPKHSHPQVYEYVFSSKSEKRLTYQDGENYDAVYDSKNNDFYYSSTTDEIKENPAFMKNIMLPQASVAPAKAKPLTTVFCEFCDALKYVLPTTEIYESHFDGEKIIRLTNSENFDGAISHRPGTHQLAFVSVRNKIRQLFKIDTQTRAITQIGGTRKYDDSPAYSLDGLSLLWVHTPEENSTTSEIWVGDANANHAKALILNQGLNIDPSWHPNGEEFVFASNNSAIASPGGTNTAADSSTKNFEIYVAKKDGGCLRRLTYHTSIDRWPVISPDGKKLFFTSDRSGTMQSGTMQIYWTDYQPPPCQNSPQ